VALHPLAEQFAAVAGEYERGRPNYPLAVVGALAAELGLAPGASVLDLAAGTGRLSRVLMAAGFDVVAVEPTEALREPLGRISSRLLVQYGADMVLIDAGVKFPEAELHGVDLVVCDYGYVADRLDGLLGILFTHGHEDHNQGWRRRRSCLGRELPRLDRCAS